MSDRYELIEVNYVTDKRIVHISNVSWALADALREIVERKCVGRLVIKEMNSDMLFSAKVTEIEAQAKEIKAGQQTEQIYVVPVADMQREYSEMHAKLKARIAELDAALVNVTARLVAAVSLLERGGKKAAPSNRMFNQMIVDYKNCIERSRAALRGEKG